ncbi:DUF305 domain-containing protein [Actinotalea sp. AC32]|nr:DUF305 domain-containing protein [Actinotalea sp. AC32]
MTTTTRRRLAATASALALAATLTACAGDADEAPASTSSSRDAQAGSDAAATEHNDADAQFAQMMIIHHEGAVEMADLAVERAESPDVVALAERISAAQGPEIELMSGWLEAWGEDPAGDADMSGMDHGGMDMEGMDQDEAMGSLSELEGTDFDRSFLDLMTAHHRGAIEMSEEHLEDGVNAEALELSSTIIDDQTAEIAEMEEMLADL